MSVLFCFVRALEAAVLQQNLFQEADKRIELGILVPQGAQSPSCNTEKDPTVQ